MNNNDYGLFIYSFFKNYFFSKKYSKFFILNNSVARLLFHRPAIAILDEHTSALDTDTQERVLKLIADSGMAVISVSHRAELQQYHTHVLEINDDCSWRLIEQDLEN